MANEIKVTLKLDGTQEFRSQLKAVGASAADLKKDFAAFGSSLANVATNFAKITAAVTAATTAIVAMTLSNAKANEEILKLSEVTGASTDRIQELTFAAQQVGIEAEAVPGALEKFSISLGKLKTPSKDMEKLLADVAEAEKDLREAMNDGSKATTRAHNAEQKRLSGLKDQNKEIARYNQSNKGVDKALKSVVENTDKLFAAQERSNKSIERARERLEKARAALNEVDEGEGNLAKTLADLNPQLAERLKLSTSQDDAFITLIEGVKELNSVEEQNLVITAALGKSNINFSQLVRLSKEELLALFAEAKRTGQVIGKDLLQSADDLGDTVDVLKGTFNGLKNNILSTLNPAIAAAAEELTEFIVANRQPLIDFAQRIVPQLMDAVGDLFQLIARGGDVKDPNETALKIYNTFVGIRDAASAAIPIVNAAASAFDTFARAVGFASGQQAFFIAAGLKVTGLLQVMTTGFTLLTSIVRTFLSVLTLVRAFVAANAVLITAWGAAIVAAGFIINSIVESTIGWDQVNKLITDFFVELGELAPFILQEVGQLITDLVTKITEVFSGIPTFIAEILGPELTAKWIEMLDSLLLGLESFATSVLAAIIAIDWGVIGEGLSAALAIALTLFTGWLNKVIEQAKIFGSLIGNFLVNGIEAALNTLPAIASSIFNGIKASAEAVISSISGAINAVKSFVSSEPTSAPGLASGGLVAGKGTSTSDSIVARLSDGEFVVRAAAVRKYGIGVLQAINSGMLNIRGFASGGLVDFANSLSASPLQPAMASEFSTGISSGRPLTLVLPNGNKIQTLGVSDSTAKQLEKELRSSANAKIMQLPEWYSQ